jgi:hypothetical protein
LKRQERQERHGHRKASRFGLVQRAGARVIRLLDSGAEIVVVSITSSDMRWLGVLCDG